MFCSNCGAQIPDGSKFCPHCGHKMTGEVSSGTTAGNVINQDSAAHGSVKKPSAYPSGNYQTNGAQNNSRPYQYNQSAPRQNSYGSGSVPGKGAATASLVLGIVAIVFWFLGWGAIVSVICGIIGIILSSNAKKAGFTDGLRTAGLVLSIIGLVGGAIALIAVIACVGTVASVGHSLASFDY